MGKEESRTGEAAESEVAEGQAMVKGGEVFRRRGRRKREEGLGEREVLKEKREEAILRGEVETAAAGRDTKLWCRKKRGRAHFIIRLKPQTHPYLHLCHDLQVAYIYIQF